MKLPKFSPKRLFRSNVSRPDPSSFSSGSSSSSNGSYGEQKPISGPVGSVTPTSVLPEISGEWSEASAGRGDVYSEMVQAFKMIDRDDDGLVSRSELEVLLSRLGPEPPSREEVSLMLSEVDRDGDGCISLEQLASRVAGTHGSSAELELREAFEFFDADRDGKIAAEELHRVFSAIGDERCTLDDCRRMIANVDSNGDGFVCFADFSRMMELQR